MLLGVQVVILSIAILVRYSPICLIGAVIVSALLALRGGSAKRVAVVLLLPLAGILIALYGVVPLSFPGEASSGRLQTLVWHRAFIGYGANPDWPFPGLRDRYRCPQVEGSLVAGIRDSNGACVWAATPANQPRPSTEIWGEIYGPEYEAALRKAFFYVAFHYPRQSLEAFLYYKPLLLIDQTRHALIPWPRMPPGKIVGLAAFQTVLLVGFLATEPAVASGIKLGAGAAIGLALALSAAIPHLVAWTTPATGQEMTAGVLAGGIICVWLSCRAVLRFIGRRWRGAAAVLGGRKTDG